MRCIHLQQSLESAHTHARTQARREEWDAVHPTAIRMRVLASRGFADPLVPVKSTDMQAADGSIQTRTLLSGMRMAYRIDPRRRAGKTPSGWDKKKSVCKYAPAQVISHHEQAGNNRIVQRGPPIYIYIY